LVRPASSGAHFSRSSWADHELVAVSRSTHATGQGVRWVEGDASSADDVARAIEGAEAVYYLVHSLGRRDFDRQDRLAAENVAAACELARVKQIVYLGGLGDDDPTASPHLRSRRETGERLSAGAVPVTTLRAAMIVGRGGSAAFETIVALVDRLPAMITPSWVSTPSTVLAGIMGMNFQVGVFDLVWMFWAVIVAMVGIAVLVLSLARSRRWI
jgi:uncharacterized protein YbjT (DUF2867 family)